MKAEFYSPEFIKEVKDIKAEVNQTNWLGFIGFAITMGIVLFDICAVLLILS